MFESALSLSRFISKLLADKFGDASCIDLATLPPYADSSSAIVPYFSISFKISYFWITAFEIFSWNDNPPIFAS
jgi:hypothetical protein